MSVSAAADISVVCGLFSQCQKRSFAQPLLKTLRWRLPADFGNLAKAPRALAFVKSSWDDKFGRKMGQFESKLPKLGDHALAGQLGEALVEVAMLQLGQVYHRRSGLDFGIDGVIELVAGEGSGEATGREIGVQVKRGLSVLTKTRYGRTLYCSSQHANYWLNHSLPVVVVHAEPGTDRLRWRHVSVETLRQTGHGYAIDLPEESNLRVAIDDLRALAMLESFPTPSRVDALILPYNFSDGVLVDDEELGLAALAFSRAALRGNACRVDVAMEDEADLIASIDAIRDIEAPTAEQRRDAIVREDILYRHRKHAKSLRRALTLLLTEPVLVEAFGYKDQQVAAAIRRAAPPAKGYLIPGEIHLQAWPGYHIDRPIVSFDLPPDGLDAFYDRDSANRVLIRMGASGGVTVLDLPAELVATRFLPLLVHALVRFADTNQLADDTALEAIGVHPSNWLIGIA